MPTPSIYFPDATRTSRPRLTASARGVVIHFPPLVIRQRFGDGGPVAAPIDCDVVLVAVLADVFQQVLQPRDFDHAVAAEALRPVVGDVAFAVISPHASVQIVGGGAAVCERAALELSNHGAESIVS